MISGLSLHKNDGPSTSAVDFELATLKGHLGLCSYAIRYWISHVLAYLTHTQPSESTPNELLEHLRSFVKASKRPDILPRQPSSSVDLRQFQRLGNELEILAFLQTAHTFAVESLEAERAHESAEGGPPALGPLYFVLIIHSTYNLGH
jgi:hypothetical protein